MNRLASILIWASMVYTIYGANILVLLPNHMYSHTANFMPIIRELANRGHNVTLLSPFPQKKPIPNLTEIILPNFMNANATTSTGNLLELDGILFRLLGLWMFGLLVSKQSLQHPTIQRFIRDKDSKFDLVITETWFLQEPLVAFGYKYNAPVINLMPSYMFPQAAHLSGNYFPCTYVPVAIAGGFSDRMSFFERVQNCFLYLWNVAVGELYYLRKQDAIMREHFRFPGSENLPPLTEMLKNTSLTLSDHNPALGYPMPLHKNVIEFGGYNIQKPDKLPKDLQTIMDSASNGVIYFSFGSHANVSFLKQESQKTLLTVFSKVRQMVFMKSDDDKQFNSVANSKNILKKSWFPQPSVIAHPNCKLFITHGGLHGLMEAVQNAVPVLVIPLFGDQLMNAKFVEATGIGYVLKPNELTDENLLNAINQVLNNPLYRQKIQERSAIFRDKPIDSLENVIYWIEYVIRHKGAPHLRPAVLDLHWYQVYMLDIIAFYLSIIIAIISIDLLLFKLLFNCLKSICFKKDKNKPKKE